MHGKGTFTWQDGRRYEGEYQNDKMHGKGTFTWQDGKKYVGDWEDGKRDGQGVMLYKDGSKYVGDWEDGKMHGYGIYTDADNNETVYKDGISLANQNEEGIEDIKLGVQCDNACMDINKLPTEDTIGNISPYETKAKSLTNGQFGPRLTFSNESFGKYGLTS